MTLRLTFCTCAGDRRVFSYVLLGIAVIVQLPRINGPLLKGLLNTFVSSRAGLLKLRVFGKLVSSLAPSVFPVLCSIHPSLRRTLSDPRTAMSACPKETPAACPARWEQSSSLSWLVAFIENLQAEVTGFATTSYDKLANRFKAEAVVVSKSQVEFRYSFFDAATPQRYGSNHYGKFRRKIPPCVQERNIGQVCK